MARARRLAGTERKPRWCSDGQMGGGDLEHSSYAGCEFCDGKAGWDKS